MEIAHTRWNGPTAAFDLLMAETKPHTGHASRLTRLISELRAHYRRRPAAGPVRSSMRVRQLHVGCSLRCSGQPVPEGPRASLTRSAVGREAVDCKADRTSRAATAAFEIRLIVGLSSTSISPGTESLVARPDYASGEVRPQIVRVVLRAQDGTSLPVNTPQRVALEPTISAATGKRSRQRAQLRNFTLRFPAIETRQFSHIRTCSTPPGLTPQVR